LPAPSLPLLFLLFLLQPQCNLSRGFFSVPFSMTLNIHLSIA
jgi:hypothetical protein